MVSWAGKLRSPPWRDGDCGGRFRMYHHFAHPYGQGMDQNGQPLHWRPRGHSICQEEGSDSRRCCLLLQHRNRTLPMILRPLWPEMAGIASAFQIYIKGALSTHTPTTWTIIPFLWFNYSKWYFFKWHSLPYFFCHCRHTATPHTSSLWEIRIKLMIHPISLPLLAT